MLSSIKAHFNNLMEAPVEFSTIEEKLSHFFSRLDHDLLGDPKNDPFVRVTLINLSTINPHGESFFRYLNKPGQPAEHTEFYTTNMTASLTLEAQYLTQKPSKAKPIEEALGTSRGFSGGNNQTVIITIISNLDDSIFLCKSIIKELQILFKQ